MHTSLFPIAFLLYITNLVSSVSSLETLSDEYKILANNNTGFINSSFVLYGWDSGIYNNDAIVSQLYTFNQPNGGRAYIYKQTQNSKWIQTAKIFGNNSDTLQYYSGFGISCTIHNNFAAIGAYIDIYNPVNTSLNESWYDQMRSGSVYIFEKINIDNNYEWIQTQKLVPNSLNESDYGGGLFLLGKNVAATDDTVISASNYGVYIWERVNMSSIDIDSSSSNMFLNNKNYDYYNNFSFWNQTANFRYNDSFEASWDVNFGVSVDIDDNYAIIGALWDDLIDLDAGYNISRAGSAFIYKKDSATGEWWNSAKIFSIDPHTQSSFGTRVGINSKNNVSIICESNYIESNNTISRIPRLHIYEKSDINESWLNVAMFYAEYDVSNISSPAGDYYNYNSDAFGTIIDTIDDNYCGTIDISDDNYILVSAAGYDGINNNETNTGCVYIYAKDEATQKWYFYDQYASLSKGDNSRFGFSAALYQNMAISGAAYNGGGDGEAYIWSLDNSTNTNTGTDINTTSPGQTYASSTSDITSTDGDGGLSKGDGNGDELLWLYFAVPGILVMLVFAVVGFYCLYWRKRSKSSNKTTSTSDGDQGRMMQQTNGTSTTDQIGYTIGTGGNYNNAQQTAGNVTMINVGGDGNAVPGATVQPGSDDNILNESDDENNVNELYITDTQVAANSTAGAPQTQGTVTSRSQPGANGDTATEVTSGERDRLSTVAAMYGGEGHSTAATITTGFVE